MALSGRLFRVHYLVTRGISRPQRAFSTIANHQPVLDVLAVCLLGCAWMMAMELVSGMRMLVQSRGDALLLAPAMAATATRYAWALAIASAWGASASFFALMLGGKPRLLTTQLAHALAVAVAYGMLAFPIAVIRLVDHGELSSAAAAIVEVSPWVYLLVLLFLGQLKIHKTVANRAVAYLALGAMPLLLAWSALRWWHPALLPPFLRW